MKLRPIPAALALSLGLLSACATIPDENKTKQLVTDPNARAPQPEARVATFIRSYDRAASATTQAVNLDAPLYAVIRAAMPDVVINPMDGGVDAGMRVVMNTDAMPITAWLERLMRITNQDYEYRDGVVFVRSVVSKQWTMPAYTARTSTSSSVSGQAGNESSSTSSGGSSGGINTSPGPGATGSEFGGSSGGSEGLGSSGRGSTTSLSRDTDEWENLVETAKRYTEDVIAIRSQGVIRATGKPLALLELDRVMRDIHKTAHQNVSLSVAVFEVSLADSRARGIDWSTLFNGVLNVGTGVFSANVGANFPATLADVSSGGLNIDISAQLGSNTPVDLMLNLLSRFGTVELTQQPQVTTLNGRTAFVGSGEQFGFLASVSSTLGSTIATVEPQFERVLVGVEMAITPMLLDDGRIMVEAVPILTNFRGFDNFEVGGNRTSQPRIAVQQLATTAIARSGEPIQIGGLIQSRLVQELNRLPFGQKESMGLAGFLFESDAQSLSRTELVVLVTPKLMGN